jgi:20S proteasome subunit alpha 6
VGAHERNVPSEGPFRILEGEQIDVYLKSMVAKESADVPAQAPAAAADAPAGQTGPAPPTGDDDVQMNED